MAKTDRETPFGIQREKLGIQTTSAASATRTKSAAWFRGWLECVDIVKLKSLSSAAINIRPHISMVLIMVLIVLIIVLMALMVVWVPKGLSFKTYTP